MFLLNKMFRSSSNENVYITTGSTKEENQFPFIEFNKNGTVKFDNSLYSYHNGSKNEPLLAFSTI